MRINFLKTVAVFLIAASFASCGGGNKEGKLSDINAVEDKSGKVNVIEQAKPVSIVNLTYRLILDYAERMARLAGETSPLVSEITKYIRKHLSEPISVEALARHLCRGRSRLSTDFKQVTGENLSEFILKKKIEEGKKLLRRTDKPAVEIAFFLGFSSQSHFSRTFKKYVGQTPNTYRKEMVRA